MNEQEKSALHQKMIADRNIPTEVIAEWEDLNGQITGSGNVPYPPPWAYEYFGGRLRETPSFPGWPGFHPEPITPEELLELRLLLTNGKA